MNGLPDNATIGELYGPAMEITDQAQADLYFELLVARQMLLYHRCREEAEQIERSNLGYYAGYCGSETRLRVERLFRCEHPVFGSLEKNGPPTPDQAMMAGVVAATKAR